VLSFGETPGIGKIFSTYAHIVCGQEGMDSGKQKTMKVRPGRGVPPITVVASVGYAVKLQSWMCIMTLCNVSQYMIYMYS